MPETRLTMSMQLEPIEHAVLVCKFDLMPRGSGNRGYANALADEFKQNRKLQPHIKAVRSSSSRVVVEFIPSPSAAAAVLSWQRDCRAKMAEQMGRQPMTFLAAAAS